MFCLYIECYIFIIIQMEQLKCQNSLLLSLVKSLQNQINSKNKQNQTLFQQYQQLGAQNQAIQQQLNQQRQHLLEIRRKSQNRRQPHSINFMQPDPRIQKQLAGLRQRQAEIETKYQQLRSELQGKCSLVLDLQNKLEQNMKRADEIQKQRKQISQLKQNMHNIQKELSICQRSELDLKCEIEQHKEKIKELRNNHIATVDNYNFQLTSKEEMIQVLTEKIALNERLQVGNGKEGNAELILQEKVIQLQAILASKELALAELTQYLNSQSEKAIHLEQATKAEQCGQIRQYENQIQELQQIIASKSISLTQLSEFLQQLSLRNRELQQRIEQIKVTEQKDHLEKQKQLQKQNKNVEVMSNSNGLLTTELTERNQQLLDQINTMNIQIQSLKVQETTVNILHTEKDRLLKQVEDLSNQIILHEQTRNHLNSILIQVTNRVSELEPLQQLIEQMKYILSIKSHELTQSQSKIVTKDRQLNDLIKAVNHQVEELKMKDKELAVLQQQFIQNSGECNYLKQNIKELEQIIINKQLTISEFSQCMADQAQLISQMEERQGKTQSMLNTQEHFHNQVFPSEKVSQLERILQSKEQSLAEIAEYLQEQMTRIQSMQEQKTKLQQQLTVYIQRAQTSEQQLKIGVEQLYRTKEIELQKHLQYKRQMLSEIEKLLDQKIYEMENIKIQISQKQQKVKQLQHQTKILKDQLNIRIQQMKEKINLTQSQYQQFILINQYLKQQNYNFEDLAKQKKTSIKQLQSTIQSYHKQIEELKIAQSNYQSQLKYFQSKIKENITDEAKFKEDEESKAMQTNNNHEDQELDKMGVLMDVMDSLHYQVRSKDIIIQQMTSQIQYLKDKVKNNNYSNQQINIEGQVKFRLQQQLQSKQAEIDKIKQNILHIQTQLQIYKQKCIQFERKIKAGNQYSQVINQHQLLNKQELQTKNHDQIEDYLNLQELNVTQILQKILFYSKESKNVMFIVCLAQKIQKLQAIKMKEIQKQINQYKQKFANLMQVNTMLQDGLQKLSQEIKENAGIIQYKDLMIHELQKQLAEIEERYGLQVKQMRTSMGCFEESPIDLAKLSITVTNQNAAKDEKPEEQIKYLKSKIQTLNQNNGLMNAQLQKLRSTSSQQIQRQTKQLNQVKDKCRQYEQRIQCMSIQYKDITESYYNLKNTLQKQHDRDQNKYESINLKEEDIQDYSHQQAQLRTNMYIHNQEQSYHNNISQQHSQYQQMQLIISQKNQIIAELKKAIDHIEKGYNTQMLSLHRNIAELNNKIINLQKNICQNSMSMKDAFVQNKDVNFFKHEFRSKPFTKTITMPTRKNQNQSYYTESGKSGNRMRIPYQQCLNEELTLGQKMMGRKCRASYVNAVRSHQNSFQIDDHSSWSRIYN